MADYDERQMARNREDLVFIVRFLSAAQMVEDRRVFVTFLDWLAELLAGRGVPVAALVAGLDALRPLLQAVDPDAVDLLDVGVAHLAPDR
jgi:hypothetical protein